MFADLVKLIHRRPPDAYERGFIRSVTVTERPPRNRRVERLLWACWGAIILKSWLVVWLFGRYHIPVNPLWVIAPTVIFAVLVTVVYLLRD
jgi:hypothetical protein